MKPEATSPAAMNCSNCLHKLGSDDRFCSQCGQEVRTRDESISTFLKHFLSDYFTFDSKIMRSFGPLMFSPGVLTVEFIAGRRARYIPPLRMYIFVSIVFFLSLSLKGGGSGDLSAEDVFWNRFFEVHLPRLFFLLLPLFALLLHALNARMKNGGYVRHFVFALHFHSFIFVSALVYLGLSELMARFAWGAFNVWMGALLLAATVGYLFISMKRVYKRNVWRTLLNMVMLIALYALVMTTVVLVALLALA